MTWLYIAGPITTDPDHREHFNSAFNVLTGLGYEAVNPVQLGDLPGDEWQSYLRRDLALLCKCDGVVVLPGWQGSEGASLEVDVAERLGMPVYTLLPYAVQPISLFGEGLATVEYKLIPRVRLIGLSGYARTGKDTVGKILVEQYGYTHGSFAAKLKELAEEINPIIDPMGGYTLGEVLWASGWEWVKDNRPESRRFLQALGTGVREVIGADTWVRLALRSLPDGSRAVFSDVRFPNEAGAIKKAGGAVWRIERDGYGPVNGHVSETALDDFEFDWYLYNNSDLGALGRNIADALDVAKLSGAA